MTDDTDNEKQERAWKLALIWRHTHPDYRGITDRERSILVLREGQTVMVKLSLLTDAEIKSRLAYALRQEAKGKPGRVE